MSLEASIASCVVETGLAGLACFGAAETGGLAAATCVGTVAEASISCYEAGKETSEWLQENYPEAYKEPLEIEIIKDTEPNQCLDPNADDNKSWNEFYKVGSEQLTIKDSQEKFIPNNLIINFKNMNLLTEDFVFFKDENSKLTLELSVLKELLLLHEKWSNWYKIVSNLKFSSLDSCILFVNMLNKTLEFINQGNRFKKLDFLNLE